jgi:tRNA pseudouridine55 synthase
LKPVNAISDLVLLVDKPSGPTSFDVVRQIRRAAGARRVGHGGTLDPLASGVLPVCLGEATKLAQFFLGADKRYDVTLCLGSETDTDDSEGRVTATFDVGDIDAAAVGATLARFRGAIRQVPPAYAAIKRDGRPLYAYARAGEAIEVAARHVTIHALDLVSFDSPASVRLRVACSKGTYVRALVRDLGRALGVAAHVTALRRTLSGAFQIEETRPLDDVVAALSAGDAAGLPSRSLAAALGHLPQRTVGTDVAHDLRLGRRVVWTELADPRATGDVGPVSVIDPLGALVAVAERRQDGLVRTLRVFGHARDIEGWGRRKTEGGTRAGERDGHAGPSTQEHP